MKRGRSPEDLERRSHAIKKKSKQGAQTSQQKEKIQPKIRVRWRIEQKYMDSDAMIHDWRTRFEEKNGVHAANAIKNMRSKERRFKIIRDGTHPDRRVRKARKHSEALDQQRRAKFPEQERKLFEMFRERRMKGLQVSRTWLRSKMKQLVEADKPKEWEKFAASDVWNSKFRKRYSISSRQRTNKKPRSAKERMPMIQKFHRTARDFRKPPPNNHPTYGRFTPRDTFHFDQVPCEFSQTGKGTLETERGCGGSNKKCKERDASSFSHSPVNV